MKELFEMPEMSIYDLTSNEIMDILSTEYIDYTESSEDSEQLPDEF